MMMGTSERPSGKRSGGFGTWMLALGVAAAVGTGVITASAMAASHGDTTPPRAETPAQHHTAGVTTGGRRGERSDSDVLQVQDLPDRREAGDWARIEPTGRGSALACVPTDVTQGLGAQASEERRFGARTAPAEDTEPYAALVGETVLQFADPGAAVDAMQSVASWLQDCAAPDLANPASLESRTITGPGEGHWELYLRTADKVCTECDAVYFDREALVHVGDRLIMVSLSELGGPLEPDGLADAMSDLAHAAIEAAS
jgi:hypothetical protein